MQQVATKAFKGKHVVYLMRGVPASGKSYAAKKLAGRRGLVCETDSFFGSPGINYNFKPERVDLARNSNMKKFKDGLKHGISPIVVDRGNGKGHRTRWYAQTALDSGYEVRLAEPVSDSWKEIKALLVNRRVIDILLRDWAGILALKQERTHGVQALRIRSSMDRFDTQLTVKKILEGVNG